MALRTWLFAFAFLCLYISENQYQMGLFVCMYFLIFSQGFDVVPVMFSFLVSSELWLAGSAQCVMQ
jgi:hypothetical protein